MLWLVALVMMILLCLCGAVMALQGINSGQFTNGNSIVHSSMSVSYFWMTTIIAFYTSGESNFTFWTLPIFLYCCFALFCLVIYAVSFQVADFAIRSIAVSFVKVFVKLRKLFEVLAFRASFCLNCFSHSFLRSESYRLELVTRPILVPARFNITKK